jgi:hypothetical protein
MVNDFVWRQFLWFSLRNGLWYGEAGDTASVFEWTSSKRLVRHSPDLGSSAFMLSLKSRDDRKEDDQDIVAVGTLERLLRRQRS